MAKSEISECLQRCELFSRLNRQEVENIAGLGRMETYQAGENILNQGDFGENLYIIAEGMVVLERSIDLGTRRGSAVIGLLGKGRALGCWSALLGEPHTYYVVRPMQEAHKSSGDQGTGPEEDDARGPRSRLQGTGKTLFHPP